MYRSFTAGPDALWICTPDRASARGRNGEQGSLLAVDDARRVVARCVGDPIAMGALRSVLASGFPSLSFRTMSDRDVVETIERGLARARLSLGRRGGGDADGTLSGAGGSSLGARESGSGNPAEAPAEDPAESPTPDAIPRPQSARPASPAQPPPDPVEPIPDPPVTAATVADDPPVDDPPLSFYELVLLDELEGGIPGVPIDLTTPAGRETLNTDGSGRVRVNDAPPGSATARIVSGPELTRVLEENIAIAKRTTPLPEADDLVVLTPSGLSQTITFPDAIPQRVMLVTRTDLVWGSVVGHWGTLTLLSEETDPVRLLADIGSSILQLSSTGAKPRALIGTPPTGLDASAGAAALGFAEGLIFPSTPPPRLTLDIDALHEALFAENFDAASALIDLAQQEPPEPPLPEFPVLGDETVEFAAQLAALALQGETDVPTIPDKQI